MNKISPSPGPVTLHVPTQLESEKDLQAEKILSQDELDTETSSTSFCSQCSLLALWKVICGVVLGACVAVSWAWATYSAKETLLKLPTPFFIIWFCSIWNILSFPLYYLCHLLAERKMVLLATEFRKCSTFLGEDLSVRLMLRGAAPFSVLWILSGYLYLLALGRISKMDVSTVLCCSHSFAFLLSWIALKDRFMGVRIVSAILSITGIVMLAYADGFHSDSITGVALGVGSASTSALFKVLFRKRVGMVKAGPACLLLSCVGLCGLVLHSWICVLLYFTHVEYWPDTQDIPWVNFCVLAALLLVFNLLLNLGEMFTYHCLISMGILMTIPASAAVETFMTTNLQISHVRVSAAGIIAVGYLILHLPENWDENTLRWIGKLWHGNWQEESLVEENLMDTVGAVRVKAKPAIVALS